MKIVSFLGRKGGVGKTTNSHATAHGLSMVGIPAAYIMTDNRELLSDEKRVYSIIDGKTVPQSKGPSKRPTSTRARASWSWMEAAIARWWTSLSLRCPT